MSYLNTFSVPHDKQPFKYILSAQLLLLSISLTNMFSKQLTSCTAGFTFAPCGMKCFKRVITLASRDCCELRQIDCVPDYYD